MTALLRKTTMPSSAPRTPADGLDDEPLAGPEREVGPFDERHRALGRLAPLHDRVTETDELGSRWPSVAPSDPRERPVEARARSCWIDVDPTFATSLQRRLHRGDDETEERRPRRAARPARASTAGRWHRGKGRGGLHPASTRGAPGSAVTAVTSGSGRRWPPSPKSTSRRKPNGVPPALPLMAERVRPCQPRTCATVNFTWASRALAESWNAADTAAVSAAGTTDPPFAAGEAHAGPSPPSGSSS